MTRPTRRTVVAWGLRLLFGVALGWGFRLVYERRPLVRFATGMAVRSVRDSAGPGQNRGPHLRDGQPHFFSLAQIMDAPDPAAALRAWREALERAPEELQRDALHARAEVSVGALRRLLLHLSSNAALREEMNELLAFARERGADLYDPHTTSRSLMELARLDAGLALDGAHAIGSDMAVGLVWAVIAEDNPQRVLELVASGQAPPEALPMALRSLAASDLEKASALFLERPDEEQSRMVNIFSDVLARTRPLEALTMQPGNDGKPDQNWAELIIAAVPGPHTPDFLLGLERQHPELLGSCAAGIHLLLQREARRDPGFVFDWMERQEPNPGGLRDVEGRTLAALAAHDPARAAALFERWTADDRTSKAAQSAINTSWMRREPMAAIQWITAQPDAPEGWELGAVPPAQASSVARWLSEQGADSSGRMPATAGELVKPWLEHDPAAAVAWTTSLPEGPARARAMATAAEALAGQRSPAANALLDALVRSSPEVLGTVAASVDPARRPLGPQVAEALPHLMRVTREDPHLAHGLARHLAHSVQHPSTQQGVFEAIGRLPDPAQRQRLLQEMAADPHVTKSLPLVRQLAAAMPDQEAARTLVEMRVIQRFYR